jgi:hypothetical protein
MSRAVGTVVAHVPSNGALRRSPLPGDPNGRPWLQEFLRLVEASGRESATDLPPLREWVDLSEAWYSPRLDGLR